MRHLVFVAYVAFVLSTSAAAVVAGPAVKAMKEERPGLLAKAKITAEVATATAEKRFPKAKLTGAEIEEEDGRLIYSFDFKTKGKSGTDEVNVDAMTGEVVSAEHESPKAEARERANDAKAEAKVAEAKRVEPRQAEGNRIDAKSSGAKDGDAKRR